MKNRLFNTLLIIAAYLLTCGAVATGSYFRGGLSVSVGDIALRKIKATSYVENKIATERNRAEAETRAAEMKPILSRDNTVGEKVRENLENFFTRLVSIRQIYDLYLQDLQFTEEENEYMLSRWQADWQAYYEALDRGENAAEPPETPPQRPVPTPDDVLGQFDNLPVIFTENQKYLLVTLSVEAFEELSGIIVTVADAVLEQGISELDNKTFLSVRDELNKKLLDEDRISLGYQIICAYLMPNVTINEETTQMERAQIAAAYEVVFLQKDQTLVDEGYPITEEAYAMMESLGMLNTGIEYRIVPMVGAFVIIAIVFLAAILFVTFYRKTIRAVRKEALLLFVLYAAVLGLVWALGSLDYPFLPLLVFAMLVSMLIDLRTSILLSVGFTVIGTFIVGYSPSYLYFFTIASMMIALLARYTTERNKVFLVGVLAALINFLLACAVALVVDRNIAVENWSATMVTGGYAALNGVLTVILCTGSLPFWEVFFGVVTPIKLLDLTNPVNVLLRRLTIEAPGTYHHSLIVANLAETAAYDIGANPNTARVGGYYHDIGKLKYPQYFYENVAGENPHDSMDPFNSAQIIISHVTYGLTLAEEYRLPQFIRDIIREHHGTTLTQYFYNKALNENPGQPVAEKDFRYPYVPPQTKESACVMLADTVEAAVRATIPRVKSINEIENLINNLIRDKLNDGQLIDSQLSIKDVSVIGQSFFRVLKGMYHERIQYPKMTPTPKKAPEPEPSPTAEAKGD